MKVIKKILIAFLIAILLGGVVTIIFGFTDEGKNVDITPMEPPKEEPEETPKLNNLSDYTDLEINEIIDEKRNSILDFFQNAKYYNISEIDENYTTEDNENLMVLDEEFLNELHSYLTDDLFSEMTEEITFLKEEDNKVYYKSPRHLFDELFYQSALTTFDLTQIVIYPTYATNEQISSLINIKICEENTYELCRRDDKYDFNLIKIEDEWKIDKIGSN